MIIVCPLIAGVFQSGTDFSRPHAGGRMLNSLDSAAEGDGIVSWLIPMLLSWLLNGVVLCGVLAKLFVYGEPVTVPHSESSVQYWRHRKQADVDLARVSF